MTDVHVQHFLSDIRTDNSNEPAANVIRDKLTSTSECLKSNLPQEHNMKKLMNDFRRKTRGCPASTATCAQDVSIPLSNREDSEGGLFVLEDLTTQNNKRIVAFSSELSFMVLNQIHNSIFMDGTFKTSPKHFKQIWILRGNVDNLTCVPLTYFLIEDKSSTSYSESLNIVKNHCPEFSSLTFMVDFEKSEHIAIRNHFPNAIIKGCLFHWKQCLLRRFRKIKNYADNELMKTSLHSIYGLAFVPVQDVMVGWTCLKSCLSQYPETAEFVTYFESTWLNNPCYPVEMWNHYESTLNDDPRTNNFSEGSNNALNTAAGCSSPTMSRLMDILTKFTAEAELKILQSSTGMQATRKPRNKFVKRNERIEKTVQEYSLSKIALYCRSMGHLSDWQ